METLYWAILFLLVSVSAVKGNDEGMMKPPINSLSGKELKVVIGEVRL